jgi:mRNA turnover protein 4
MPKSKRAKVFNLTQVTKKPRERKEKLFDNIRETVPDYQYCFVFSVDNMRNNYLKDVRHELTDSRYVMFLVHLWKAKKKKITLKLSWLLTSSWGGWWCRIFFGKTKLMARALGTTPAEAQAEGIDGLTAHLSGSVGLLFTNRTPETVESYFSSMVSADFARAGVTASRSFTIPPGPVYSTGGEVPAEHDVLLAHNQEPELRRLGMPTRLVKGRVVLGTEDGQGEPYTVCREGDVLDSRQTRLLKLFGVCLSEFRVKLRAYWTASNGEVTILEAADQDAMDGDDASDDE